MAIEGDEIEILGGVRFGRTLGSPVAVVIRNTEWPDWQKAMPPSVKDALNDRRAPEYRDQLDVSARLARVDGRQVVGVEVVNNGSEIVSLLPLRVVLEDADGTPLREMAVYAATPLLICDEWPGPVLPGAGPRKVTQHVCCPNAATKVTFEITDLRVANNVPAMPEPLAAPGTADMPAKSAAVADAGD